MKFTTNTKPLNDVLAIAIVNANISKFYKVSSIVQLTATTDKLIINVDYERICMQIELLGNGDADYASVMVDSSSFKQFMSTISSSTVTIDFKDDGSGIAILAGKSKFNIPKLDVGDDSELKKPEIPENYMDSAVDLDKSVWKFVKNHQSYALATSKAFPVFRCIWVGSDGDILVGDYENSVFTHSKFNALSSQCLINSEILNILMSAPDDVKITKNENSYILYSVHDSYGYTAQFTPLYEGDDGVGSYNSDIFLGIMNREIDGVEVNASDITTYLTQAEMLNKEIIPVISFDKKGNTILLHDRNVNCEVACNNETSLDYSIKFNTSFLRKVLANYGDTLVKVKPIVGSDNEVSGIIIEDDILTSMIASVVVK